MRLFAIALFFVLVFCMWEGKPAFALLKVDITKGRMQAIPMAFSPFSGEDKKSEAMAKQISAVVQSDLERSGLFQAVDNAAFIEHLSSFQQLPIFANWRVINASALVMGEVTNGQHNQIEVKFRLFDTYMEKQVAGSSYNAPNSSWRRIAHIISDEIYSRLTGEEGYFDTRIVYIAENGSGKYRVKRLAIMDQDGANHKFLTDGSHLVLTPRFSPAVQQILYLSYYQKKPRVYLRDIATGREHVLGDFAGMTFAPRFSPNGKQVLLSAAHDGNSDIYRFDLQTRQQVRLTSNPAIDTSPSFSADMKQIVFNSDRGGSQQLYVMDSNGKNVHRISFSKGRYGSPIWSPRGDLIAFTKMYKGQFYIGVMRPDGSGERLLTESYLDESPTWAPNGRRIIFTRQTRSTSRRPGVSRLYSIDLTGHNEREVITPIEASDPAWSPLLGKKG